MNAVLHYRTLRQEQPLAIKAGAKVTVLREVNWTGDEKGRPVTVSLLVEGELNDKGRPYPVKWKQPLTTAEIELLPTAIDTFVREANNWGQGTTSIPTEREIWMEVTPWLRIGFIHRGGKFHGYYEFSRDTEKLRAEIENLPMFGELRRFIIGG